MAEKTHNYTTVCWYCGVIFKNNRRTGKYCNPKHNSLYEKNGARVSPMVKNFQGFVINGDERLSKVYNDQFKEKEGWCAPCSVRDINGYFDYGGPLPKGDELMVVGSYLIKRIENLANRYDLEFSLKPFTLLTVEERATAAIIKGEITEFKYYE